MSHTFAYAIRIGTRGILKQDGVGLGDACLTNASEQVPPKNSSTGSTGHLQPLKQKNQSATDSRTILSQSVHMC
jgi:hypothetical protein